MTPVEYTLEVWRGTPAPIRFGGFATVGSQQALDVSGSTFHLVVRDVLGATVLEAEAEPGEDQTVTFELSDTDTLAIPAGEQNRYEIVRRFNGVDEPWLYGVFKGLGRRD